MRISNLKVSAICIGVLTCIYAVAIAVASPTTTEKQYVLLQKRLLGDYVFQEGDQYQTYGGTLYDKTPTSSPHVFSSRYDRGSLTIEEGSKELFLLKKNLS